MQSFYFMHDNSKKSLKDSSEFQQADGRKPTLTTHRSLQIGRGSSKKEPKKEL